MLETIFITLMLTASLALFYYMARNEWVFRLRMWMIWADIDQFETMPSYDAMIWRFWVWSARGFGWK